MNNLDPQGQIINSQIINKTKYSFHRSWLIVSQIYQAYKSKCNQKSHLSTLSKQTERSLCKSVHTSLNLLPPPNTSSNGFPNPAPPNGPPGPAPPPAAACSNASGPTCQVSDGRYSERTRFTNIHTSKLLSDKLN